jgi:hypothetical protein
MPQLVQVRTFPKLESKCCFCSTVVCVPCTLHASSTICVGDFACSERLSQRCSLFFLLFKISLHHMFCFNIFAHLALLREYLFLALPPACSFASSERLSQRCSLFFLLFKISLHHMFCFHIFAHLALLREYLFLAQPPACSFASSERLCQCCFLFFLLFNLAFHHRFCFRAFCGFCFDDLNYPLPALLCVLFAVQFVLQ